MQFLSEIKRIDEEISRIESEANDFKLYLKKESLEILKKSKEEAKVEIEDILGEIEKDLEEKAGKENQRILESEENNLLQLRDRAQKKMDKLVEATLKMVLDSG